MATNSMMSEPFVGELDRRVTIRQRHDVAVGVAGLLAEYPQKIQRWARIVPVGTAVWAAAVQTDQRVTHRCIVRRVEKVTNDYEVVSRGRVFAVRRCAELRGRTVYTVLDLEELGDVGVLT